MFIDWSQNNGAKTTVSPTHCAAGTGPGSRTADLGRTGGSGICGSSSTKK